MLKQAYIDAVAALAAGVAAVRLRWRCRIIRRHFRTSWRHPLSWPCYYVFGGARVTGAPGAEPPRTPGAPGPRAPRMTPRLVTQADRDRIADAAAAMALPAGLVDADA